MKKIIYILTLLFTLFTFNNISYSAATDLFQGGGLTAKDGVLTVPSLSVSSGVYTDANSKLTSTPPYTGTLGFWLRSGTTLNPANTGDAIYLLATENLYMNNVDGANGEGVTLQWSGNVFNLQTFKTGIGTVRNTIIQADTLYSYNKQPYSINHSITHFIDYNSTVPNTTKVTTTIANNLPAGTSQIYITGTTSYNGAWTATFIDATNFYIAKIFVADDATGIMTTSNDYERLFARWSGNIAEIGTEAGGSGIVRDIYINTLGTKTRFYADLNHITPAHYVDLENYPGELDNPFFRTNASFIGLEVNGPQPAAVILDIAGAGLCWVANGGLYSVQPPGGAYTAMGTPGTAWTEYWGKGFVFTPFIDGGTKTKIIASPDPLTVTPIGTPGTDHYGYKYTIVAPGGGETLPSTETVTTTGNAVLDGTNNNYVYWTTINPAEINSTGIYIRIYRTTSTGTPSSLGLIYDGLASTVRYGTFYDTGIAADTTKQPPTIDTSGSIAIVGNLIMQGPASGGTGDFLNYNVTGSNYERTYFRWDSNIFKIGTEAGGSGTGRAMILQAAGSLNLTSLGGNIYLTTAYIQANIGSSDFLYGAGLDLQIGPTYFLLAHQTAASAAPPFWIYNNTTANWERAYIKWDSNTFKIGTEKNSSGTLRDIVLLPGSSKLGINNSTPAYATDIEAISSTGTITFTSGGGAVNDMTKSGTFIGSTSEVFCVQIDGSDTPDTFKWGVDNCSTWIATLVPISGGAQLLQEGVSITFGSTNTHTVTDKWTFTTTVVNPLNVANAAGTSIITALNNIKVGINTNTPNSTFHVNGSQAGNVTTYNTSDTVLATDYYVICNSATPMTMTLVTSVGIKGRSYIFKNIGAGTCTVAGYGGTQTIDGLTTQPVLTNASLSIFSDNANWLIF